MDILVRGMTPERADEYSALFAGVFGEEPWNERWSIGNARIRIENMMRTCTFVGKALYRGSDLIGMIWGQKELHCNGVHFQIQEFCVKHGEQRKGYGKVLLRELENELKKAGATNIYLITSRGERTEGYYRKHGFRAMENMLIMYNDSL